MSLRVPLGTAFSSSFSTRGCSLVGGERIEARRDTRGDAGLEAVAGVTRPTVATAACVASSGSLSPPGLGVMCVESTWGSPGDKGHGGPAVCVSEGSGGEMGEGSRKSVPGALLSCTWAELEAFCQAGML